MSFLTEYFDEYRQHPIRKTVMCRPENRWAKLEGKWLDPKTGTEEKAWTDEEVKAFIKKTMKSLRGQSTYFNDYCAHIPQEFKTGPFVPRPKKKKNPCKEKEKVADEEPSVPFEAPKLAMKDTELMKVARDLYERDMDKPTLEPLPTHIRLFGYARPCLFKTGLSDYQFGVAKLAYELVRDGRIPRYHAHNGCRARWGYPPEGQRQPEIDVVPFKEERLY